MTDYEKTIHKLLELKDPQALEDALELCKALEKQDSYTVSDSGGEELIFDDYNFHTAHGLARRICTAANQLQKSGGGRQMLDLYFNCHLFDAPYWFDSFCIYLERDREPRKKFYVPRRPQLLPVAEALQDLEDGKLEILGISLAPGVGKAVTNDTPILTRKGWKNHGDLVVGDEVIGLDGKFKKVTHVHPKCMLDVMVEFTNGEKIQCHENHEWLLYDRIEKCWKLEETKVYEKSTLKCNIHDGEFCYSYRWKVPERSDVETPEYYPAPKQSISVKSITRVEPKEGNCITVEGDGMYLAGRSLIPTHNTTLAEFFLAWQVGKHPELANLIGSHNRDFLGGVYNEMLRILDRDGEYRWHDVFPSLKVIDTNAKSMMIDIGKSRAEGKRFATLEFSSIGSQNAGKVRAQNLLYCDDLVDGIETAMSKDRLDKLWQMYYTDLRQRKIGDRCKELHIATRWSLYDVIGRLEREYADDPAARFIKYPVEDENGESLYNYPYGLGYTTKMLQDQKNIMDDASYRALFLQEPIEREGRLYDPEELRRYSSLPDREPDAVFAICDTKEQGDDYAVMPIVNQYGQDYYVVAFVCYNGKVEVIEDLVVDALMKYKVKICQVESNRGGMIFAQNIANRIKALGGGTNITTKWTQTNKETRIIVNAVWVKKHCLFKYENDYKTDREYKTAMNLLYSYSMAGRNKHDDAPDVMALLAEFCTTVVGVKAQVFNRIW